MIHFPHGETNDIYLELQEFILPNSNHSPNKYAFGTVATEFRKGINVDRTCSKPDSQGYKLKKEEKTSNCRNLKKLKSQNGYKLLFP